LCASIVRRDEAVVSDWVEVQDGALGGCGGEGGGYDGAGCEEEVGEVHCFWSWVGLVGCVGIGVNSEGSEVQRDVFGKGLYEVWGVFGSHLCTRLLAFLGLGFLGGACGVLLIVRPRFFLSIDAFAYSGNGSDVALYRSQRRVAWNAGFGSLRTLHHTASPRHVETNRLRVIRQSVEFGTFVDLWTDGHRCVRRGGDWPGFVQLLPMWHK
jgi:hypothetical protein